ncbi:MAG TPA: permease, partial [Kofleriaceae bacterium]|nr:permease [Kofleriaceae bacterium]
MDLTLLIISLVAFAVGPALYRVAGRARASLAGLDGFVMVAVAGLALVHIIPHAVVTAGGGALAVALAGFIGPNLVEHRLERAARQTHTAALVLALAGLTVHEFFDGIGLAEAFYDQDSGISVLAVAVVLHRLPIAITVWWLLCPLRGPRVAWLVLAALGAATVLGYASVGIVDGLVDARWLGLLEALIAGSLLHVVVHRPSPLSAPGQGRRERLSAGVGALLGLAAVAALGSEHHIPLHGHASIGFGDIFTTLVLKSAPVLLLAFALAGLIHALFPRLPLPWMRTGNPTTEAMRGVAFGLPRPIYSCGVIPLYQSLVAQAVPASAALAFLVATPHLGIDSLLISLPLLGLEFSAVRVLAAVLIALVVGSVLGQMVQRRAAQASSPGASPGAAPDAAEEPRSLSERLRDGVHFGFGQLVDHTAPWIVLGIAIAAVAEPALHGAWLTVLPWGIDVVVFSLLGMPMYLSASGATPLVAVLIHK